VTVTVLAVAVGANTFVAVTAVTVSFIEVTVVSFLNF
jgi:hypothetical protein